LHSRTSASYEFQMDGPAKENTHGKMSVILGIWAKASGAGEFMHTVSLLVSWPAAPLSAANHLGKPVSM